MDLLKESMFPQLLWYYRTHLKAGFVERAHVLNELAVEVVPPSVNVGAQEVLETVVDLLPLRTQHHPLSDGDPLCILQVFNALLSLLKIHQLNFSYLLKMLKVY